MGQKEKIVVVDLGFSAAKYKYGETLGRTPSAYRPYGEGFVVGAEVLETGSANYLRTPADLVRYYPLFVDHVLGKLGISAPVALSVGLPYQFWKNEKKRSATEISGIDQLAKGLTKGHVTAVHVYPQGLGGIVCHLAERTSPLAGNVLGIDFGFNTIIATLYSRNAEKVIWDMTYYKKGVHQLVTDFLAPLIERHLPAGRPSTPIELAHHLEKRSIQHGFDEIPIDSEIERAATKYMEHTLSDIVADLQTHAGVAATFKDVLFFGGGARHLPILESKAIKMTILPEPEFANARGFEILANQER